MANSFVMPVPYLGQIVLWSYNKRAEKNPAVVTRVGRESIAVLLHVDGLKDHVHKTGVRHTDDPLNERFPEHDAGHWEFTGEAKRINELAAQLEKLSASLGVEV